jgi:hypothetical protein
MVAKAPIARHDEQRSQQEAAKCEHRGQEEAVLLAQHAEDQDRHGDDGQDDLG